MALETLRRPEYTGERRCWPCTVVNVALVGLAAGVVAAVGWPLVATALAVLGLLAVWLRGYVVPYTPQFAPRLVDAIPGAERVFPKAAARNDPPGDGAPADGGSLAATAEAPDGEAVLERLVEAGVVVPDGQALALAGEVREAWRAEMRTLRDASMADLAAAIGDELAVDPDVVDGTHRDYVVVPAGDDAVEGAWLSRHVAIAELAAVRALADAVPDRATRLAAADAMRGFLETCPVCDTPVEETTTVACCGGPGGTDAEPDHVLACPACDARLLTLPDPEAGAGPQ